jgi:hypothetical protein
MSFFIGFLIIPWHSLFHKIWNFFEDWGEKRKQKEL